MRTGGGPSRTTRSRGCQTKEQWAIKRQRSLCVPRNACGHLPPKHPMTRKDCLQETAALAQPPRRGVSAGCFYQGLVWISVAGPFTQVRRNGDTAAAYADRNPVWSRGASERGSCRSGEYVCSEWRCSRHRLSYSSQTLAAWALQGPCARIPAIALTAYARTEDRVKAIGAGYQSHLKKPVEPIELVAMIRSLRTHSTVAPRSPG